MGYYIETKESLNKADQLLAAHLEVKQIDESSIRFDKTRNTVLVCVVENGSFDAAGICHSWAQMCAFVLCGRPKRWLVFPRDLVLKLNPNMERLLAQRPAPRAHGMSPLAFYRSDKVLPSDWSFCPPGGGAACRFLLLSAERGFQIAAWEDETGEFHPEHGDSISAEASEPFFWAPLIINF